MDNIVRSSKSDPVPLSSKGFGNIGNVSVLGTKAQSSSLVEATVSEIRPGGDVILATPQGLVRTSTALVLLPEDRVMVRITQTADTEETTATILNKIEQFHNKIDPDGISLFKKYITSFIFGTSSQENLDQSVVSTPITATISYLVPNRNIIKYGGVKPGDKLSIQILSPDTDLHGIDILSGEVVSNDGKILTLNTSIGILNISAKSNFSEGDKVLFNVLSAQNTRQNIELQYSIQKFLTLVSGNITLLKSIFMAIKNIGNSSDQQRLVSLISSQHDTATLAKLFYQARIVPEKDVERWINEEIVEPFEASNKGNKLSFLSYEMAKIGTQLEQLKILPETVWYSIPITIPDTTDQVYAKVKKERNGVFHFTIEIDHKELGKILLQGIIETRNQDRHLIGLNLNVKYSEDFPKTLSDAITSSFTEQTNYSGIEGSISFEKIVP